MAEDRDEDVMRHRGVHRRFTSALLVAALIWPPGASARRDPGPTANPADVCAFRLGTIRALFGAANGAGLAGERLRAGDGPAAPRALSAATGDLSAELRRVKKSGRVHLGKPGRRNLAKALAAVRRAATKAARAAKRKPASAIELIGDAAARIGSLLAEQTGAYRARGCAGGELRVGRLHVPDGETRRVPGGAVIVAGEGIELRGDLVTEGAPADGLTLVAERGDIVLEGGVDASGTPLDAGAGLRARAARWSWPRALEDPGCGDGGSVSITALTGSLVIGARHFVIAGDGTRCPAFTVSDATLPQLRRDGVRFSAARGGAGGHIQLEAAQGTVRFAPRVAGDPAPFSPGSGATGRISTSTRASCRSPTRTGPWGSRRDPAARRAACRSWPPGWTPVASAASTARETGVAAATSDGISAREAGSFRAASAFSLWSPARVAPQSSAADEAATSATRATAS